MLSKVLNSGNTRKDLQGKLFSKWTILPALFYILGLIFGNAMHRGPASHLYCRKANAHMILEANTSIFMAIFISGIISYGFLSYLILFAQGVNHGYATAGSGLGELLAGVVPHGIPEISSFILSSDISRRMSGVLLKRLISRGGEKYYGREADHWEIELSVRLLTMAYSLLLLACCIETFITPGVLGCSSS